MNGDTPVTIVTDVSTITFTLWVVSLAVTH